MISLMPSLSYKWHIKLKSWLSLTWIRTDKVDTLEVTRVTDVSNNLLPDLRWHLNFVFLRKFFQVRLDLAQNSPRFCSKLAPNIKWKIYLKFMIQFRVKCPILTIQFYSRINSFHLLDKCLQVWVECISMGVGLWIFPILM
jgi:hypothetical protein